MKKSEHRTAELLWRRRVNAGDIEAVRGIVASSGFFSAGEVATAVELVEEYLNKGEASGYHFLFADENGRPVAYACFGLIANTQLSWDLYWIAVAERRRRGGLGGQVLARAETVIAEAGGRRIYVDTSSRPQYEATRRFYARHGYEMAAEFPDFHAPGDGKIVYLKVLQDEAF
jgi:GNAT superfamily N-acetyltransferase